MLQNDLAPFACHPSRSRGRIALEPESENRTPFQRDRDRVLRSGAFRKLKYKTQVFVYHEGDYYRTRMTHSLEVAQIARSICRTLRLNEDLTEAMALAHDLGHTPFGHAGEAALNLVMASYGGFQHNDQTLRILTHLERRYADFDGLNLTWETLEGVVKHNGPLLPLSKGECLPPTISAFQARCNLELNTWPGPEAQVAALSDDIAYNNHDLDDGLRAGLFSIDEIAELSLVGPIVRGLKERYPKLERSRLIHETIRRLINLMVTDLVDESRRRLEETRPESPEEVRAAGRPLISFSNDMREQERPLRAFLRERMYQYYLVNRVTSKSKRVVSDLFSLFLNEPNCLPAEWQRELKECDGFLCVERRARLTADYIAGMTDRYALMEYQRLFDMNAMT
ncbi:Deoxyguanosinetriphosphate triphosphohydrolase-like protein [Azospirillaceae bacterium]